MVTFARDGQSDNDADAGDEAEASAGDEIGHLHRALQSQPAIEQAKGLLMASTAAHRTRRSRCSCGPPNGRTASCATSRAR